MVYKKLYLIGLGSFSNSSDMLVVVNSEYETQFRPTLYVNFFFQFWYYLKTFQMVIWSINISLQEL